MSGFCDESFRPLLERWRREGPSGEPVKRSDARTLWRWEGAYVKQFADVRRARREFENLRALAAKGFRVPAVLALEGSTVFTRELAGARPLREALDAFDPKALGRFAADLAATGLVHGDFHIGNILVHEGGLWLVDLHRARFEAPNRLRAVEMLGFLMLSLSELVSVTDRLRVLAAYGADRSLILEVHDAFLRIRHYYWGDRLARVLIDSASTQRLGDLVVTARVPLPPLEGELVKAIGRRELRRTPGGLAVKTTTRGFWRGLVEGRARGPAVREWRHAWALKFRRLPVPDPVALVSSPDRQSYACRWIDGALPLNEHVKKHGVSRELIMKLARLVRKMHDRGAAHRDLKANNVLVRNGEIWFIDLDRVTLSLQASLAERFLNLAQLNAALGPPVTRTDRLRFYHAYAGRDPEWHLAWKPRVQEIMDLTRARKHIWPA